MAMSQSGEQASQGFRIALALLLLAMAAVAFVALCLVLEDWQSTPDTVAPSRVREVFTSQPALIVYCTILAGVLGTSIRILSNRLSTQGAAEGGDGIGAVAAQVFLGGAFAFAAGFLLPHALAARTIADSYNVWSLMIVGGFAGYASTGVAGSVHEGLQGLLAGLRQGVAEAIVKEELSRTIANSAREAMALPEPVAYTGLAEIDISDEREISAVQAAAQGDTSVTLDGPALLLRPATIYYIRIRLRPQGAIQSAKTARPISLPIDIEGEQAELTPLDIRIDYGFDHISIGKHQVEVRSSAETEVPAFVFRTPSIAELEPSSSPSSTDADLPRRLTISILQNRIPYVRQQIPITLNFSEMPTLSAGKPL